MCKVGENSPAPSVVFTLQLDYVSTFDGDAVWTILETVSQNPVPARRLTQKINHQEQSQKDIIYQAKT